jgi:hypothetical protein
MSYSKGDFYNFLTAFRVEKGAEFTHTSISKPSGSFYIPSDNIDEFYDMYSKAIDHGEDVYLTERHRPISPFLIDLDFRFEKGLKLDRKYTPEHIKKILSIYIKQIKEYVDFPATCRIFLMEKPSPVIDKDLMKDGIHIILPDIVTKPDIQFLVRKNVLKDVKEALGDMDLKNVVEDVVDEAVIFRNNWQMCGSKKPNCEAYKVTKVFNCSLEDNDEVIIEESECNMSTHDLVTTLSIRNKYDETQTKIEKHKEVEDFAKENSRKMNRFDNKTNPALQTNQNNKKNTIDNIECVEKLVDILSENRANGYLDWIRVGWCLRNIDYRLLPKWVSFSQKSTKYTEGECERLWNYMKDDGLGIGTLHMWAKQDNEEKYLEICKKDLGNLIYRSTSETHTDIARVVHFMYKYQYVCVSIKLNLWYEFRGHKWVLCDSGHTLRSKISNEVVREYYRQAAYYNEQATREDAEADQQRWGELAKKLNTIALKLKQSAFKDNIMKESKELFFIEKFEEKLDSRCHLIGFENGVFDLDTYEFRDGRPEDYISFTTGINYIPYDSECENAKGMMRFISTIFTKQHVREYVLTLLSSFLNGNVREEKFHIWTGTGCHKKDTGIMMYDGSIKKVQDIKVGEQLMGDDSTPRTVKQLFRGYSDMYNIIPIKGDSFTVNGDHILSLKATNMVSMSYRKDRDRWSVRWAETDNDMLLKLKSKNFENQDEARAFHQTIFEKNPNAIKKGDVIDVSVKKYIENCKRFGERNLYLYSNPIEYQEKAIPIDPWFLGYWLGNGHSNFTAITTQFQEVVDKVMDLYGQKYDVHISGIKRMAIACSKYSGRII